MFNGRFKSETRSLLFSTFMGILMTFTIDPIFAPPFSFSASLITALTYILLTFVASLIFPSSKYGELLAKKFNLEYGKFKFVLVSTTVTTVYLTFVKIVYCTIVNSGFSNALRPDFLKNLIITLILDFIYRVSLYPPVMKILGLLYPEPD
ncbi:MAG: hypothetical protein GX928_06870 [Ruminococcaceae bacterium]|nr:hypothetical protein [Oscillospiraceae bacterium]